MVGVIVSPQGGPDQAIVRLAHRISFPFAARLAGTLLGGIGFCLLALSVAGENWQTNSPNPGAAHETLRHYIKGVRDGAAFDLREATEHIYRGTTHSTDRRIAITENWLQWTLGQLHPPLARTQNADRLLAGQLTDCSERSLILKTLAEHSGHPCRFVGLSGHVVLEVQICDRWQVADPDYGVVYPVAITALERDGGTALLEETLQAAGHESAVVEQYRQIVQSTEDNVVLPVASPLSPRLDAIERSCIWLAVLLPLGLVIVGGLLWRSASLAASNAAHSRAPGTPGA